ncbi:hypothetical protein SEUCBS139899_004866 [Sporothrix eucalyptigena]
MNKPKRQRTKPPGYFKTRHASPFRSPSRSPPPGEKPQPTSTGHAGRPALFKPSHTLHNATVPANLFENVRPIPAKRYTLSNRQRAHYYLFEKKSSARAPHVSGRTFVPNNARMLNYVQLVTTPTADTPGTCLLVHHDNRRYLFGNVAEGTQRAFVQQKVSLAKAEEVFLTGTVDWRTAGGLLGLILTLAEVVQAARAASLAEVNAKVDKLKQQAADEEAKALADAASGKKVKANKNAQKNAEVLAAALEAQAATANAPPRTLSIHGGTNLTQLLATARRFIFRKGLPLKPHEVREDIVSQKEGFREPDWSDDNIMVWYVPVFVEGSANKEESRKRVQDEDSNEPSSLTEGEHTAADRDLVASVVNHMFDSDWRLDALVETTLLQAKLPAKLFVKDDQRHLKAYDGPMPGDKDENGNPIEVADIPVLVRQPWPAALIQSLPHTQPARQSMCYIVRNHPRRGKFNAAEAKRLGVASHDNRRLVAGESVIAADGSTVTPDMVVGASVEGAAFAVVELPDASYVEAFLAKLEWADEGIMKAIDTIFWLLGPGVVSNARLQAFMQQHPRIRHTVSSTDTCANRLALNSAAALQVQHHRVDPDRFPIQQYDNAAPAAASAALFKESGSERPLYEGARPGWTVRLSPTVIEEESKVYPYVNFDDALKAMDPKVLELADAARKRVAEPSFQEAVSAGNTALPHPDTQVIPLGTGSAMPSKYRNVSATLVRVPGVGSYLLDCGENTLGSMQRMLGSSLPEVLREMRVLWISHLHADHHLGTVSVIRAWHEATKDLPKPPRLMVASHVNMLQWLREYAEIQDFGLDRVVQVDIQCNDFPRTKVCTPYVLTEAMAKEFGIQKIDAVRVEHCHGALAVVFTWRQNGADGPLKVAYSGDCRPSSAFAQIGQGATLLIHESTFDDELKGEALAKKHSTMGEALQVGRDMGARRVLLTHFSQRYPKIPVFDNGSNNSQAEMQVLVAFDQMRVRLADFKTAAAFLPALQKLYEGEEK